MAQPIMKDKDGVCSASFNITNLAVRNCTTEILINLHNLINEHEKLLSIANQQWAEAVFGDNEEFKENIWYSIIENKAKLSILRDITDSITNTIQKGIKNNG